MLPVRPSLLHTYIALIPFHVDAKCRTIGVVWANSGVTSLVYSSCDANRFYRNSAWSLPISWLCSVQKAQSVKKQQAGVLLAMITRSSQESLQKYSLLFINCRTPSDELFPSHSWLVWMSSNSARKMMALLVLVEQRGRTLTGFLMFSVDAFTLNPGVLREQLAALTAMLQQHPEMSWTETILAILPRNPMHFAKRMMLLTLQTLCWAIGIQRTRKEHLHPPTSTSTTCTILYHCYQLSTIPNASDLPGLTLTFLLLHPPPRHP